MPTKELGFRRAPRVLFLLTSDSDLRCYLYYCEDDGTTIADDLFISVEEAMASAEQDFNVQSNEWDRSPWPGEPKWAILMWTGEDGPVDSPESIRKFRKEKPKSN